MANWGYNYPTYRGPITPCITIVGAHLVTPSYPVGKQSPTKSYLWWLPTCNTFSGTKKNMTKEIPPVFTVG